jgi:hypothetical protein
MDEFAEFAQAHKRARARGRPTKLTATVQVIICIALHRGATLTAACGEAGVSLKTVCEWLARGRGEDPQRPRIKDTVGFIPHRCIGGCGEFWGTGSAGDGYG